jgi:dUTP pyrophosphatase
MKIYRDSELAEIPSFATEGSACFDLRACLELGKNVVAYNPHNRKMELPVKVDAHGRSSISVQPSFRVLVPTGLIFDIPKNHVMNFYIRSSMALKYGLMLANNVAVIDSDFKTQSYIMIFNASDTPCTLYHGDRIAQAELRELKQYTLTERKTPPEQTTERTGGLGGGLGSTAVEPRPPVRTGGLGSTGVA